jgi:aspartate-semialdehyde dehydrogenase
MLFHSRKIAIVGAATLLGKELNEVLSSFVPATTDFLLLDDEEAMGKIEAAGEEVTFVQRIVPTSFRGCDYVFFAAQPETTEKHWQQARRSGACVVDLTGALEKKTGVVVLAPWMLAELAPAQQKHLLDLKTAAVVPAHPAALMLALVAVRCQRASPVHSLWATLLQPASEYGKAALTELHQQTVNLLSFQSLSTLVFGAQSAFNLAISFGREGRVHPGAMEEHIRQHYAAIAGDLLPELDLQVVQAPTFHGHVFSVAVEFEDAVDLGAFRTALAGEHVEMVTESAEAPDNIGVTGGDGISILVRPASETQGASKRYWLWMVADNLRLAALQAVACAVEMGKLLPQGKVQ